MNLLLEAVGGASGNMLLGALLDVGLAKNEWLERLGRCAPQLSPWQLEEARVVKRGIPALHVDFTISARSRSWGVDELLDATRTQPQAQATMQRLVEAEASAQGRALSELTWTDHAGCDLVLDILGFALAVDLLGVKSVYATPLPLGQGFCLHQGQPVPNPNPAVAVLMLGKPVYRVDLHKETVTTTGAAIFSQWADFNPPSPYRVTHQGYGAGSSDFPIANVVRASLLG